MSEWIDIKTLPKKRGDYLCWQPDINHDDEISIPARAVVLSFTGNRFRSSFAVTHWMPIQEPPK